MDLSKRIILILCVLCALCGESSAASPHVVFVTGDDEYGSELSMPMFAALLEKNHGMRTTVLYAEDERGQRDRHGHSIPGLDALRSADLAVFFMRFRALPQEQLDEILRYARSGKPMIGLRTTSHAFKYPDGPNTTWNDGFGRDYFGQKWISHHGHGNSSLARVVPQEADHPILRGVAPEFWLHSWLYIMSQDGVGIPEDCRVLVEGDAIRGDKEGGEKFATPEPLAWARELPAADGQKQRIFFTSLGHPKDFLIESPRRMMVNAIYWALGQEDEIPAGGADAEIVGKYDPPDPK